MTTEHIDGIRAAAAADAVVANSARARHQAVQDEQRSIRTRLADELENADISRRARIQEATDQLGALDHEFSQTRFIVGQPPVGPVVHHPLNLRHWSPLQWILAIVLAVIGLLFAALTFDFIADIFGNPMDDWRTVLKIVWAFGWSLLGFGLGGLIGYALDPNNRQQR